MPAIFETYGVCQSDILTTVPLTVAATTTTVTTTLPLTTTVSVYPGLNRARDAFQAEITPFPRRGAELEQRDLTEIHSWVCTETGNKHRVVPQELLVEAEAKAKAALEEGMEED